MAFQSTDLYLPSGTGQLINNWVDPVYKFDSSSFYNWEQDNLPIYDLEDRDDYLYEMAGYPTSAVDGIMLTVSACGVDNKKVFGTIADAVEALPNTIRQPIIIEVCTSGQLGGMHIENREFEGSTAGLEIINRGFAKVLCGNTTSPSATIETFEGGATTGSSINLFSSVDLSNTMTDSSSLGVSNTVWQDNSKGAYDWWGNFTRTFVLAPEWATAATATSRTVTMSTKFTDTTSGFLTTTANQFHVGEYTDNSIGSETLITNPATSELVQRAKITGGGTDTARVTGLVYANAVSGISVKDCGGKVYIRGFCVDGADSYELSSAGEQRTDLGFDIENSQVVVENCTATRCRDAGMQAVNSHVTLNRGFVAFRNYELYTDTVKLDTKQTSNPTPGLKALNSTITLSATAEDKLGLPLDAPFCFYKNMVGIDLINSILQTPEPFRYRTNVFGVFTANSMGDQSLVVQSFFNQNEGIKATNSTINTGQIVAAFQNTTGVSLDNSVFKVANITVDHNRDVGLFSNNSNFNYNQHGEAQWGSTQVGAFYPITNFTSNGQHVKLYNSTFVPTLQTSDTGSVYTRLALSGSHGMEVQKDAGTGVTTYTTLPAVVVTNESYMDALGVRSEVLTSTADGNAYQTAQPVKGSMFQVTKGSNLRLGGFGTDSTMILGPYASDKQQKTAALYAGNNSTIKISGPTTIVQFGVNALAEESSTIDIGPFERDGVVDASSFNLGDTANHTKVQLHATRACLVANKNSNLFLHDLGDYHKYWRTKQLSSTEDYDTNSLGTSSFTSDGYLQFYPNPYAPYGGAGTQLDLNSQAVWPSANNKCGYNNLAQRALDPLPVVDGAGATNQVSSLSYGGMCVRAVGSSEVTARNINFLTGWANTSGPYYDVSTTGNCDLLRIWNIADNSELHASYLSVSSLYPEDTSGSYYGPSAVWTSGGVGGMLSGAPSSTPNTSSLSVLDSFGLGADHAGELGYYGKTTFQNVGPFRIYVSPHPKAKWLGYVQYPDGTYYMPPQNPDTYVSMGFDAPDDSTIKVGAPYQIYAQGYATSSDCSATHPQTASGVYEDLGLSGYIITLPTDQQGQNVASSFFYTSSMLPCDSESRIWLDESAMNTFANAKNGTLGTSGRKKIFSYYKAIKDYPGEAWWQANAGFGRGLGSANLFDLDRDL